MLSITSSRLRQWPILVVAANTAFADFPRLSSILARDNYMPHVFGEPRRPPGLFFRHHLFSAVVSALLLIAFRGNVDSLIHLYAVGVFLAFSMSDTGMVVHWWKTRGKGWKTSIIINGDRCYPDYKYSDHRRDHQVRVRGLDYRGIDPDDSAGIPGSSTGITHASPSN
jgi:hypothetical protein